MLNKTTSANFLKFGKVNENFNKDFLSFESFVTDIRQINFLNLIIRKFIFASIKEWECWLFLMIPN